MMFTSCSLSPLIPPDETAALRELVEDLRSALQGSDARCLALEVALRKERSRCNLDSAPSTKNTAPALAAAAAAPAAALLQGKLVPTLRIRGRCGRDSWGAGRGPAVVRRDLRDPLIRELNLIRLSRDGQLAEAMKFSGHLEEELQRVYQEVEENRMPVFIPHFGNLHSNSSIYSAKTKINK